MASVEEYRRHAAECLSLARIAESADDRSRLLQMAEAWRELAERLERKADEAEVESSDLKHRAR
jgi:hypothetical protein